MRLTPRGLLAVLVCDGCPDYLQPLPNITADLRADAELSRYRSHFAYPAARAA